MKIKKDFVLRTVAGRFIVVPVGQASLDFNAVITLNETGAFLWNALSDNTDIESMTASLCNEYDVDEETSKKDVLAFVSRLRQAELLEE